MTGSSREKERSLTDEAYWESVWDRVELPSIRDASAFHELHRTYKETLPSGNNQLFEIGCAPGGWLAYFAKNFGYNLCGVEYAKRAWNKTLLNLEMQEIDAHIECADFFQMNPEPHDIVFSHGFVEHFSNPQNVVEKIVQFSNPFGGYVVTVVPAMQGLNWTISKVFRPAVAAGHYPVNKECLKSMHERCGLETLVARYYGCGLVTAPMQKNQFARSHPVISTVFNFPFRLWTHAASGLTRKLGIYPELPIWSTGIVYIGRRNQIVPNK